jgi:RNA polymerase sigma-70 factor, ECF subfamily
VVGKLLEVLAPETPVPLANPEAFRAFYARALPLVYGYLYHRCGGMAAAAEDLTQETFLAAVVEVKKAKIVTDPMPWVLGIARHKWLDQLRRQEREGKRLALVWQSEHMNDQQVGHAWREDSREPALAALDSLPPAQRAAVALRYLDGFSVPEIAQAIGRSVHATESLLARGRENFKLNYAREQA